jgi:hypothetical protein
LKALLIDNANNADVTPINTVSKGKGATSAIPPMNAGDDADPISPVNCHAAKNVAPFFLPKLNPISLPTVINKPALKLFPRPIIIAAI